MWKVSAALIQHRNEVKAKSRHIVVAPVADVADVLHRTTNISEIMHDRLFDIEAKYAKALVGAGVFNDSRKKPKQLQQRSMKTTGATSQPQTSVPESATVTIKTDGSIDTTLSVSDVVKTLGLQGNGVGGLVGVRSQGLLLGTGLCFTATEVKILNLNPPEATVAVKGFGAAGYEPTVKVITVPIDDLVALDPEKEDIDEQNPLKKACESPMPRLPGFG